MTVTRPSLPFCLGGRDIALGLASPLAGGDAVRRRLIASRNASSPSGRPINSLRRSAAKAGSSPSHVEKIAKRGARSMSGRTLNEPVVAAG